jgi:hypothetical protein
MLVGGWATVVAVVMVLLESARRAPRRYLSGEGFTGASPRDRERSEMGDDNVRGRTGTVSAIGFLPSPTAMSSLDPNAGATRDRLDEPEVDTVESDEDDA